MTLILQHLRRWWPGLGRRRGSGNPTADPRLRHSKYLGFHADEDNGIESPLLVTRIFALCDNNPQSANRAMAMWRHLFPSHYEEFLPQRQAAAALEYETPTIVFVPFTDDDPGTNEESQNLQVLTVLAEACADYANENIIGAFGNFTAGNFMPEATTAARRAAWFALEARAMLVFEAAGLRWCSTDDSGTVFLVSTMAERRQAWTDAGLNPANCQFHTVHNYVVGGWVPSHLLYAEQSLARLTPPLSIPIRVTEMAFGFLGLGFTHADKPWLLNEYAVGNAQGYPPQSLTWTRYICQWFRTQGRHMLIFDWSMLVTTLDGTKILSSWGEIFTDDHRLQEAFVLPAAGSLWCDDDAALRAGVIALSNGGTLEAAEAAEAWVNAGNLFTVAP